MICHSLHTGSGSLLHVHTCIGCGLGTVLPWIMHGKVHLDCDGNGEPECILKKLCTLFFSASFIFFHAGTRYSDPDKKCLPKP